MNNRRNAQVAARRRRRRIRFVKKAEELRREVFASLKRGMIGHGAHAFGGTKSMGIGNPIYNPQRSKFKGYMRDKQYQSKRG